MVKIEEFSNAYHEQAVKHIFEVQNDEFNLNLTLEDQPDLVSIEESYKNSGGNFWIALDEGRVIGTIGLFDLGNNACDLRRMFVKTAYRGKQHSVGKNLMDALLGWAKENEFVKIYLETSSVFQAAMKFYMKNGFKQIQKNELPDNFPVGKVAEFFFLYEL